MEYIAVIQHANGQYVAAAANQEQALVLQRELGDRYGEANALNFLGAVQDALGSTMPPQRIRRRPWRCIGSLATVLAKPMRCTGSAARSRGPGIRRSATSQRQALDLYRELGYRMGEANVLNRMGSLATEAGDFTAAGELLDRALSLFRELGIVQGEAEVLNTLGELALADAREADARACHERAQSIADRIDLPPEQARALEGLARCSLRRGDRAGAVARFRLALAVYQRLNQRQAERIEETMRSQGL